MIDWKMAERTIELMNELLAADPKAIDELVEYRVECNETLAEHPTVQVSGYPQDPEVLAVTGPLYRVGLLGVLNGLCGALGPEGGDKEGWGVIAAEFGQNIVTRFKLLKCEQCCNPHHDGICSCGEWGEAEERKAAEWHKNNASRRTLTRKVTASELPPDDSKLEGLWDK